jgi:hypothetical protein
MDGSLCRLDGAHSVPQSEHWQGKHQQTTFTFTL